VVNHVLQCYAHIGRVHIAHNAGVFWQACAFWSSKRHLGFKFGRGLRRDEMAFWIVGVRLTEGSPPCPLLLSQHGGNSTQSWANSWTHRKRLHCRLGVTILWPHDQRADHNKNIFLAKIHRDLSNISGLWICAWIGHGTLRELSDFCIMS